MEALVELYPLINSASYLCKTAPTFSELVDDDEAMDDEEVGYTVEEAKALMVFNRGDDEA